MLGLSAVAAQAKSGVRCVYGAVGAYVRELLDGAERAVVRLCEDEREARDDSPLPIHVDPKSGLGSGLDIIHPPPVPFGGRKHGASDDFLPRAPIASVVDPAD